MAPPTIPPPRVARGPPPVPGNNGNPSFSAGTLRNRNNVPTHNSGFAAPPPPPPRDDDIAPVSTPNINTRNNYQPRIPTKPNESFVNSTPSVNSVPPSMRPNNNSFDRKNSLNQNTRSNTSSFENKSIPGFRPGPSTRIQTRGPPPDMNRQTISSSTNLADRGPPPIPAARKSSSSVTQNNGLQPPIPGANNQMQSLTSIREKLNLQFNKSLQPNPPIQVGNNSSKFQNRGPPLLIPRASDPTNQNSQNGMSSSSNNFSRGPSSHIQRETEPSNRFNRGPPPPIPKAKDEAPFNTVTSDLSTPNRFNRGPPPPIPKAKDEAPNNTVTSDLSIPNRFNRGPPPIIPKAKDESPNNSVTSDLSTPNRFTRGPPPPIPGGNISTYAPGQNRVPPPITPRLGSGNRGPPPPISRGINNPSQNRGFSRRQSNQSQDSVKIETSFAGVSQGLSDTQSIKPPPIPPQQNGAPPVPGPKGNVINYSNFASRFEWPDLILPTPIQFTNCPKFYPSLRKQTT